MLIDVNSHFHECVRFLEGELYSAGIFVARLYFLSTPYGNTASLWAASVVLFLYRYCSLLRSICLLLFPFDNCPFVLMTLEQRKGSRLIYFFMVSFQRCSKDSIHLMDSLSLATALVHKNSTRSISLIVEVFKSSLSGHSSQRRKASL